MSSPSEFSSSDSSLRSPMLGSLGLKKKDGSISAFDLEKAMMQGSSKRFLLGPGTSSRRILSSGEVAAVNSINECLENRAGSVLDSRTILKTDYVNVQGYNKQNLYPVRINGTFNLRQSLTTHVFGVGQPTIHGIRGILNILQVNRGRGERNSRKNVLWINLREEPTLYVNGRSVVLRERHAPFHNIDKFQGIDAKRIQDLEQRLKEDVVDEAFRYDGNIVVHEETRGRELDTSWESVDVNDIRTPEEAFATLSMQGYRVRYARVPTTPEKAPTPQFFDSLVRALMLDASPDTTIVFNCQTGGGRSTVGMVATALLQMWRGIIVIPKQLKHRFTTSVAGSMMDPTGLPPSPVNKTQHADKIVRVLSGMALSSMEERLEMPSGYQADLSTNDENTKQLAAGWYRPVLALIRLLENGRKAKKHVDFFCADASHLVNLRSTIFVQRNKASRERHQASEKLKLNRAATSLLRYVILVAFDAYLAIQVNQVLRLQQTSTSFTPEYEGAFPQSFFEWLNSRPEILRLLHSVEKDPEDALGGIEDPSKLHVIADLVEGQAMNMEEMYLAMSKRRGSMLNTDTILKADHIPGGLIDRSSDPLSSTIRGAKNFRNVPGTRVYAVSTPTVDAARAIIMYIQAAASSTQRIIWTNLREEPVIYINKQPFVLRSLRQPFRNVDEFVQIDADRLEAAERRLKEDILAESRRYNGRILVHSESQNRALQLIWEHISEDDVMTPREMYQSLVEAGLPVDYARLPQTPEQPPSPKDIDCLIDRIRQAKSKYDKGVHFVFNCQFGRGRSTVATAIACMELERSEEDTSNGEFVNNLLDYGKSSDNFQSAMFKSKAGEVDDAEPKTSHSHHQIIPEGEFEDDDEEDYPPDNVGVAKSPAARKSERRLPDEDDSSDSDDNVLVTKQGEKDDSEFGVILSLLRLLSRGQTSKKWADATINRCGAVENIRTTIAVCVERASTSRTVARGEEFVERGLLSLRRYFTLILVAAYQISVSLSKDEKVLSFCQWYYLRPEIKTIYNAIKGADSLKFASVDRVLSAPPPAEETAQAVHLEEEQDIDESENDIYAFVARRNGQVLTRGSIIKSDHFPGCNRLKSGTVSFEGAPNFRAISVLESQDKGTDLGIYGTGIPTVSGLEEVLKHVQATSQKEVVWINLREEPILYVNGRPFVLRKLEHPFENLEHTGISRDRVEDMERRLKVDVINEILENKGRLLVHDEDESGLQPMWENVDISEGSTSLQTPSDVYDMLSMRGYRVVHHRVPITDEQAPKVTDYDEISTIVRNTPLDAEIIFNCQMGRGRTTTGLCIATATRLWLRRQLWVFPKLVEDLVAHGLPITKSRVHDKKAFQALSQEDRRLLSGRYEAITALTRVLDYGADAKATADAVIDICDALQNLREAIHALKVTSESSDKSPVQRAQAYNRGIHYLKRYYQIVEFLNYLFSLNPKDKTRIASFSSWLNERVELKTILKRITLD